MGNLSKTNKWVIATFLLILLVSTFYLASLNSVKAESANNITINYSTLRQGILNVKFAEYIVPYTPDADSVFQLVNMTIENHGYENFNTAPGFFYVIANNTKYYVDLESAECVDYHWGTVEIPNGGNFTGTLIFQIPLNSTMSNLGYSGNYNQTQSYNIVWTFTPYPTAIPTLTPTPPPTPATYLIPTISIVAIIIAFVTVSIIYFKRHRTNKQKQRSLTE